MYTVFLCGLFINLGLLFPFQVLSSSFPLVGSSNSQQGLQVSSAIQLPPRQPDDRKTSSTVSNYLKPALSSAAQPAGPLATDTASVQKVCLN